MQHLIYINFQILFLTVYTVCIYLGTPTVLLFHYPIPKNQRMNAKYNVAVEENKCSILYHRNIIQCCITCFILQTSLAIITNADCVSRLACGEGDEEVPAMLTGGGAGSCPSQPVPTAQPGWAMGAVLSCRARAQHSSQDRAVLLKSPGHRTDLWQEIGLWASPPWYHLHGPAFIWQHSTKFSQDHHSWLFLTGLSPGKQILLECECPRGVNLC